MYSSASLITSMRRRIESLVHRTTRVVHTLRSRRIISRRVFLLGAAMLNTIFLALIAIHAVSLPNTMVGTRNAGLITRSAAARMLADAYAAPFPLRIRSKQYDMTYEQLGVYLDSEKALSDIFAPNATGLPHALRLFAIQLFRPRRIAPPLSFSQEFFAFIRNTNESLASTQDIVYVDQDNKTATLFAPDEHYAIDVLAFRQQLLDHFGQSGIIDVPLLRTENALESAVATANRKLAAVYKDPLTIIVGLNGQHRFITLSADDLRRYSLASISATTSDIRFSMKPEFLTDLAAALSVYEVSFNPTTAYQRIGASVISALDTRWAGGAAESVKVGIDSGPNTDGTVAQKYIEIDISQQKMFTFRDGKLVKSYRVSTGKDYPTPVGSFTILNKTGLGFSKIYNVWMAYWMAFAFSKELGAYFGIHELPYFYVGTEKIQRPREFIGAPNTGGCVALDVGDAKEVYQFADIGTPVVIYQ